MQLHLALCTRRMQTLLHVHRHVSLPDANAQCTREHVSPRNPWQRHSGNRMGPRTAQQRPALPGRIGPGSRAQPAPAPGRDRFHVPIRRMVRDRVRFAPAPLRGVSRDWVAGIGDCHQVHTRWYGPLCIPPPDEPFSLSRLARTVPRRRADMSAGLARARGLTHCSGSRHEHGGDARPMASRVR